MADNETKKARTIFEHLSGIKEKKEPWEKLSVMDQKSFAPFIINRWLSMDMELIETINELQQYTVGMRDVGAREVYKIYYDILPKKKSFSKYIKGKSEGKYNDNVLKYLAEYYKVSQREVIDYMEILSKDEITKILKKFGNNETQIKQWLK